MLNITSVRGLNIGLLNDYLSHYIDWFVIKKIKAMLCNFSLQIWNLKTVKLILPNYFR